MYSVFYTYTQGFQNKLQGKNWLVKQLRQENKTSFTFLP